MSPASLLESYPGLPTHIQDDLVAFVQEGRPLGHFLTAVLSNDLRGAIAHADQEAEASLGAVVRWLQSRAPAGCWGYPELVCRWVRDGGLDGIERRR